MKLNKLLFGAIAGVLGLNAQAQVNPIQMGRASNAWTILRGQQNQVFADDNSGTVGFIHRQDVTIWGGGGAENGKLRYDVSVDGGATFSNDIGVMNSTYTYASRYPQIVGFGDNANPLSNNVIWSAPTLSALGGWDGIASGVAPVQTSGLLSGTEHYDFIGDNTLLQGGLCEGLSGEFWMTDFYAPGGAVGDSLRIFKGSYDSLTTDVSWTLHKSVWLDHYLGYDGNPRALGPNMMFSPNGQDGWAAYLGDLNGGSDTTFNPVFVHSSDGGANWGAPIEVDLRTVNYMGNSMTLVQELQALWVDTAGIPTSTGRPTCTFEYDITVDGNGNPHLFIVIGSATTINNTAPAYSVYQGLAKLAVDIYSEDGGVTWNGVKVAPIYTFRGSFGTPDPNTGSLIDMDNVPQVSRSQSGSHVFYSWVDSDTTDIGFGVSNNIAPNLRIASQRISDGFMTCPKWITKGDLLWDGRAMFPTMAPEVLTSNGGTTYNLPVVILDMLTNDQNQPCQFWYFGNDATIDDTDFIAEAANLDSDNCLITGVERKPVMEIASGAWGGWHPDVEPYLDPILAAYPSFSEVYVHLSDSLANPTGELILNTFNPAYPMAGIDRFKFPSESDVMFGRSIWADKAAEHMLTAAPVTVTLDSINYNPVTREIQVQVNADFVRTINGDMRFNLVVVEDSVVGFGTGYDQQNFLDTSPGHPYFGAGNPIVGFVHKNVHRESLGGAWGTAGIIPTVVSHGDSYSHTYNYVLPAGYDPSQIKLLGYVCEYDSLVDQREIFNSSGLIPMPFVCPIQAAYTDSVVGGQVAFTDQSQGNPTSFFWAFGDGTTSSQQYPIHTYFNSGIYNVCLIATSSCGSDTICKEVAVYICDNPTGQTVSDILGTQATISWNAEPSAISYKLRVREVGTSTWLNNTILAPTTFKVRTNLQPNTDYEYQLKTVCDNNSPTGFGALGYFATGDFPCDNPTVHSVSNITATGATMHWNPVPNVNKYKVKIRVVGTTTWSFHTIWAPDTLKVRTGLLPGTDYEYKVKTFCDYNTPLSWGAMQYFTTLGECGDPTGLTVSDIEAAQATISWNAVSGALSYKLRVREVGTSTWLYNTIVAPTTMKVRTNLQPNTDYEYSLKTICSDGSSTGYGPNSNFTTLDYPCDNPSIISSANIMATEATIIWDAQPNAIKYKVKVRPVGTSTWDFHTVWAPTTFKVKTGLTPGTDYEYKVKTVCSLNSPLSWNGFFYFTTTGSEPGARLTSNDVDQLINVFPNPTTGAITVILGDAEQASVVVRNVHGQIISRKAVSGSTRVELEIEGAVGMYSVEVITDSGLNEVFRVIKN